MMSFSESSGPSSPSMKSYLPNTCLAGLSSFETSISMTEMLDAISAELKPMSSGLAKIDFLDFLGFSFLLILSGPAQSFDSSLDFLLIELLFLELEDLLFDESLVSFLLI